MSEAADYPHADTTAVRMLSAGLQQRMSRTGESLRQLGKALGYKQAVVLSHMASGRVPVPIDRAAELATALEMNPRAFLAAVVEQRHPEVDWSLLASAGGSEVGQWTLMSDLLAERAYDELTPGQRKVIREAAADNRAERRWLTPHEVGAIELLRVARPGFGEHGLGRADRDALIAALR